MSDWDDASKDKTWVKVWSNKNTQNRIEAWIMLKDPLVAEKDQIGLAKVIIEDETEIGPGPTSARIAVVDYDASCDKVFTSTRPKRIADKSGANDSLVKRHGFKTSFNVKIPNPSQQTKAEKKKRNSDLVVDLSLEEIKAIEADLHFHQVNVWATVHRTMDLLEEPDIMGRRIPWAFKGGRIQIMPHAFYEENAHYDRDCGAICFGYYEGKNSEDKPKIAFTCLSHDIVTHELGHAILDGLKPHYAELTSAQCGAFAEYFGDAVALTSMLSQNELIRVVAGRRNSVKDEKGNLFSLIAEELGKPSAAEDADEGTVCLRNAQNEVKFETATNDPEIKHSEHDYSKVLSGAYFDFLEKVYDHQLENIVKAKTRPGEPNGGDRFRALYHAARVTRRMMFRAIDYCPPVDLSYYDYAHAVYRADQIAYPSKGENRDKWLEVCIDRQICTKADGLKPTIELPSNFTFRHLNIDILSATKTDAYDFIDANRKILQLPREANIDVINLYRTRKVSADDYRVQEIVVEFVWVHGVKYDKRFGPLKNTFAKFWCGGTLVFSLEGNLLHYVLKNQDEDRIDEFIEYSEFLYKAGWISVDGAEKGLGSNMQQKIKASVVDGRVSFSKNPAMRCESVRKSKKGNGHKHG